MRYGRKDPPGLTGEAQARGLVEAEPIQIRGEALGTEHVGDGDGADVAGVGEDVPQRHLLSGMRVRVGERLAIQGVAGADRQPARHRHRAGLQRGRGGDDLVHRAGLVDVRVRSVPEEVGVRHGDVAGVEPREGRHRQDVAGVWVHHDDRPALRMVGPDRRRQRGLCPILDVPVDREDEIASGDGRPVRVVALRDQRSARVLFHDGVPRVPGEQPLVLQLEAVQAGPVHADEPEHLGSQRPARIAPAALGQEPDPREI